MSESRDLHLEAFPLQAGELNLLPINGDHVEPMLRIMSSGGVYEGLASIPRKPDLPFAQDRVAELCQQIEENRLLQLVAEYEGVIVGTIGLGLNWKHRHGGLGYQLDKPYRGRGFASRMLQKIVDHGFDQMELNRIWAETFVDNSASSSLLRRNGFEFEGVKREAWFKDGQYLDADTWSLIASDPRPWKKNRIMNDDV
ncbi:MAG: hypothetical protein CMJ39_00735 [Phycisphaerae bacterium]|nr:hypothetical protein [Phycisphaerae bacterium]